MYQLILVLHSLCVALEVLWVPRKLCCKGSVRSFQQKEVVPTSVNSYQKRKETSCFSKKRFSPKIVNVRHWHCIPVLQLLDFQSVLQPLHVSLNVACVFPETPWRMREQPRIPSALCVRGLK